MTNSENRLDRIEALLESLIQRDQVQSAQAAENLSRLEAIATQHTGQIETLFQSISRLVDATASNYEQLGQTMRQVDRLAKSQLELSRVVDSINAAVERLDRLMDFLMRQQGDSAS